MIILFYFFIIIKSFLPQNTSFTSIFLPIPPEWGEEKGG